MTRQNAFRQTALSAALGVLLASAAPIARSATVWNVVADYSLVSNPHGPWSYSANGTLLGNPTNSCLGISGYWCLFNGQNFPNSAGIDRNTTSDTITHESFIIPHNYLLMDPQSGYVTVTWKAPAVGNYQITGDFLGLDMYETQHYIHIDAIGNPAPLFTGNIAFFMQKVPFSLNVNLTKGQLIEFTVLSGATWLYLSTGLTARIEAVP